MGQKIFEYLTQDCASADDLNALGQEGWELIGRFPILTPDDVETESEEDQLVFKREKHE